MSEQANQDTELIRHMLQTAEEEAGSIREEAEKSIADRRRTLEERIVRIRREAEERIAAESERMRVRADATIDLERNRARLRKESRIYRMVGDRVRQAFRERRDEADYGDVLKTWIIEAALGLGAPEATVAASEEDRETVRRVLPEAERELADAHGAKVKLSPDEEIVVPGQGVMLRNVPPSMAYSNTVDDRLRRYGSEVRALIYRRMIEDRDE